MTNNDPTDTSRTMHRVGTYAVGSWIQRETWGYVSALEFGCGVGVYTREIMCSVRAGIDGFEPYIIEARETPANVGIEFILGDMRRFEMLVTRDYQVALFIDSLEHLTKEDATYLIDRCKTRFDKILLFIPIGDFSQEPCEGNELQRHLSIWDESDLEEMQMRFWIKSDLHYTNPIDRQAAAFATWVKP